jgi:membrane dipeptidase
MNRCPSQFLDRTAGKPASPGEASHIRDNRPFWVDGHVDLPYYLMHHSRTSSVSALEEGPFTLRKARSSGIGLFCTALYCEDRFNGSAALQHLQDNLGFTLDALDDVTLIRNAQDLAHLRQEPEPLGTLFLLENADALAEDGSRIETLQETGIRIVGLTHAGKNRLGDGNGVLFPDGLTRAGRKVVRSLEESRIFIDVAHLHPKCFWQLLDIFEGPILTSHTGLRRFCDTPRNIDLDQAREIIGRRGVIGITVNPEMLSPDRKARLEDVFVHLDGLVQEFGPDGVGIGSDFCGFQLETEGLEDITKIARLMDKMLDHGYGQEAAQRIMGLNWLCLYERLFPVSDPS